MMVADLSAFSIPIARLQKLALITNVETLVPEHAVAMLFVKLLIIYQLVFVSLVIQEIHSITVHFPHVSFQCNVSILFIIK